VSSAESLSPLGAAETSYLTEHGCAGGRRLSCCASVQGDVAIDVPEESQVHRQVIRKPFEAHDIEIDPVVQCCYVEIPLPGIGQARGDAAHLAQAVQRGMGLDDLTCSLPAMRQVQAALQDGNRSVTAAVRDKRDIIAVWPGLKERMFGVAVDVGSTTIAAHLCDLRDGGVQASAGTMNPQIRFGEDLMSRVSYIMSNPGSENELTGDVRNAVDSLVGELVHKAGIGRDDIIELTVVGNPIMQHLVLGISPVELGRAPFTLAVDSSVNLPARELGIEISPGGGAYVLPCIAGHVGADTAGVLLAETPWDRDDISLIVDVGTNAEIVLGNRHRLLAASSPTGPAFEGAQISSGQRAAPGAIERVRIDRQSLQPRFRVIGCELWSDDPSFTAALPSGGVTGICGSGIIEAIAELFLSGVIDSNGRILDGAGRGSDRVVSEGSTCAYVLHDGDPPIRIRQHDVRAIQLAKASMYAGTKLLMDKLGIDAVDRIRLAGAFGAQIDVRYAMTLGMIPDCALESVSSAGNAAGTGARIALLDRSARERIEKRVREVEKIETGAEADFQDYFVAAMSIPHASDEFRELAKQVDLPVHSAERKAARRHQEKPPHANQRS